MDGILPAGNSVLIHDRARLEERNDRDRAGTCGAMSYPRLRVEAFLHIYLTWRQYMMFMTHEIPPRSPSISSLEFRNLPTLHSSRLTFIRISPLQ